MSGPPHHLPRTWFLHSRTFWLGLWVTAFFVWLTIDSFRYFSVYRTIHGGAAAKTSVIPTGKPESRCFVISIAGGSLGLVWYDHFPPVISHEAERIRTPDDVKTLWWPQVVAQTGSSMQVHGAGVPTWLILAVWLAVWTRLLVKSKQKRRAYLVAAS